MPKERTGAPTLAKAIPLNDRPISRPKNEGTRQQCVMIGSRLGEWMVLTHPHAIVNVATVFKNGDVGESRRLYLQEDQMIRRADGYVPVQGLPMMRTFDGDMRHVVPILEDGRMMR